MTNQLPTDMTSLDTLSLFGDGDDIELIDAVEIAFGLALSDDKRARVYTMGDLHDLIVNLGATSSAGKCPNAMVYYRLHSCMNANRNKGRLALSTRLTELDSGRPDELLLRLSRITGWSTASIRLQWPPGYLLVALGVAVLSTAMFGAPVETATSIGLGLVAIGIAWRDLQGCEWPTDLSTLRDLVITLVPYNCGTLRRSGAKFENDDIWTHLTHIVARYTGQDAVAIRRHTRFF